MLNGTRRKLLAGIRSDSLFFFLLFFACCREIPESGKGSFSLICPDPPFPAFLDFLACFLLRFSLLVGGVFAFFSKVLPCPKSKENNKRKQGNPKKQGRGIRVGSFSFLYFCFLVCVASTRVPLSTLLIIECFRAHGTEGGAILLHFCGALGPFHAAKRAFSILKLATP